MDLPGLRSRSLEELSPDEIVMACQENYINFWRFVGISPNAKFSEDGGITQCVTGLGQDVFNVVLKCNLGPETIDSRIDEAIESFRSLRIPLLWHTGPLSEPDDIGRYLEARGFPNDYDLAAMAVDLNSIGDDSDPFEGSSSKTVVSRDDSRRWAECLVSAWGSPKDTAQWMAQNACFNPHIERHMGISIPRKMYLGLVDGKPVSSSMLLWSEDIAGLEMVGTVPFARRRGIGRAVVNAALSDARAMGFRFVVVLATIEGVGLYRKCGFKEFGKLPEHSMDFTYHRQ